jgi:hypothetical protein
MRDEADGRQGQAGEQNADHGDIGETVFGRFEDAARALAYEGPRLKPSPDRPTMGPTQSSATKSDKTPFCAF